jgi:quercetin dioxygenase-like cupin family protein
MSYIDFSVKQAPEDATNPQMHIIRSSSSNSKTILGKDLGVFTGNAWLDPVFQEKQCSIFNVTFEPCARTNWHYHEKGQLLHVKSGSGWVCDKGRKPRRIRTGDIIWCPAGTIHWHGADDGSIMMHQATSHGDVEWYQPVGDEEYAAKGEGLA